jgi:hypothetical protein
MTDSSQCRPVVPIVPEIRLRGQMAQISAARDQSQASFCRQWLQMSQSRAKAVVLGVPRTFPDIKPMDEESVADKGRVLPPIKPMIAHQHVKAVNTAREKCNAPPIPSESPADHSAGSFD